MNEASTEARSSTPLTLDDLTADLIWPRLLRAPGLALAPARLGLSFFFVVIAMAIGTLAERLSAGEEGVGAVSKLAFMLAGAAEQLIVAVSSLDVEATGEAIQFAFITVPAELVTSHPVVTIVFGPLYVFAAAVFLGAVSRGAAAEYGAGVSLRWNEALSFAAARWQSLLGALLGPLVVVWVIALGLAVGGYLLLNWPVVNVIGALVYFVFLLFSLVAVLIMAAFILGKPLLVPAVACESTDAVDAIQRAYAYVFGRPGRLVLYGAVLFVVGLIAWLVFTLIVWLVVVFAGAAATAWTGDSARAMMAESTPLLASTQSPEGTYAVGAQFIRFWVLIPAGLAFAYLFSLYATGSTLLYLAVRQVNDGQDMTEVWMPGATEGTAGGASEPAGEADAGTGEDKKKEKQEKKDAEEADDEERDKKKGGKKE